MMNSYCLKISRSLLRRQQQQVGVMSTLPSVGGALLPSGGYPVVVSAFGGRCTASRPLLLSTNTSGDIDTSLPATIDSTTTTTTTSPTNPKTKLNLDEFRDSLTTQQRMNMPVGRSWHARELRRKSHDDLHKLWVVLYKERNMLATERFIARQQQTQMPQPDRWRKVKKSMGAIRQVLGERKRERIAAANERYRQRLAAEAAAMEEGMEDDIMDDEDFDDDEDADYDDDEEEEEKEGTKQEAQKMS